MNMRDSTLSGLPTRSSDHVWRAAAAAVRAFTSNTNAEAALARMYPEDKVTPLMLRAASRPATLTDPNWAGPLAAYSVSQAVEEMVAMTAIGKLIAAGALRIDLGRLASIVVPGRATNAAAAGQWITEGAPKPVRQYSLSSAKLTPHKLAVITTLSREITEVSNIEDMLRMLLTEAAGIALDAAVFSTAPRGIFQGLTPLTPAAAGSAFDNVGEDLGTLVEDIASRGGGAHTIFIAAPHQATAIRFYSPGGTLEQSAAASAALPDKTVAAVEPGSFAVTLGAPEFSVSRVGTLHMEDTTPTDIVVGGVPATPVKSMFQTDSIALKMELWADWCMRAPHVSYMSAVTWRSS
jgi:hypothetical protein